MSDQSGASTSETLDPPPMISAPQPQALQVDTAELKSSYCNVCNVNSTREEVVLNFGVNHGWDRAQGGKVNLQHRVILSPQAAKRVAAMLNRVVQDYETRHGTLT